ncbi:MAG: class II aldolase/adducin family protein [Panacagrimonas sp.]
MTTVLKPQAPLRERVSAEEWALRVDLAAAYRLVALFGWDDLVFTHISARLPGPDHHFLINPYGWMFEEITASSLVKIDLHGNKVMDAPGVVNPAGFIIHSAIHEAREDVVCVMHTHSVNGVAVSAQKDGLLPLSQTAIIAGASLAYHDYEGIALREDEKPRLVADLGSHMTMMLRNHGLLTLGRNCADAFIRMYFLEAACMIQVRAQAGGGALHPVPQAVLDTIQEQIDMATQGKFGLLAWPALLRKLDRRNPGYAE